MKNGTHFRGVAVGILSRQPFMFEVTMVHEDTIQVKKKHTLGFISLVAVCAPLRSGKLLRRMASMLSSTTYWCVSQPWNTHCLRGLNATTGTDRAGYKLYVGPHGCGTGSDDSSPHLDFA